MGDRVALKDVLAELPFAFVGHDQRVLHDVQYLLEEVLLRIELRNKALPDFQDGVGVHKVQHFGGVVEAVVKTRLLIPSARRMLRTVTLSAPDVPGNLLCSPR